VSQVRYHRHPPQYDFHPILSEARSTHTSDFLVVWSNPVFDPVHDFSKHPPDHPLVFLMWDPWSSEVSFPPFPFGTLTIVASFPRQLKECKHQPAIKFFVSSYAKYFFTRPFPNPMREEKPPFFFPTPSRRPNRGSFVSLFW